MGDGELVLRLWPEFELQGLDCPVRLSLRSDSALSASESMWALCLRSADLQGLDSVAAEDEGSPLSHCFP